MQSLSAIAKDLEVSVATVSYVYNDQWHQSDHMLLPGSTHRRHDGRPVELLERMLARRVDALVMAPGRAADPAECVRTLSESRDSLLVFIDNDPPDSAVPRVLSDNRWGAREVGRRIASVGRLGILFFGGAASIAAIFATRLLRFLPVPKVLDTLSHTHPARGKLADLRQGLNTDFIGPRYRGTRC